MGQDKKSLNRVMAGATAWGEHALGGLVAVLLFLMMVLTLIDVVGRYFFDAPVPAAYEITELAMGVAIFAALPLATARRAHITVSLFRSVLSTKAYALRTGLIDLVSLLVVATLAWRLWAEAGKLAAGHHVKMFLQVPVSPFVILMSAAAALTAMVLAVMAWRAFYTALYSERDPHADGR